MRNGSAQRVAVSGLLTSLMLVLGLIERQFPLTDIKLLESKFQEIDQSRYQNQRRNEEQEKLNQIRIPVFCHFLERTGFYDHRSISTYPADSCQIFLQRL